MENKIVQALERFETVCENWLDAPGRMELVAPFAYVWHPDQSLARLAKPVGLTLQAVTHGNEVGGIDVLLECLRLLKQGLIQPRYPLGFVLGNIEAARANRRFVEKDLNRAFGVAANAKGEEQRARELEPLLERTQLFLDFHQTIEPTRQPFFIFPYNPRCYTFACALHDSIPIVTHWGGSFSKDGMCTDEYVNYRGGTGITLELGQKGFDPYHTGVGLQVALAAIQYGKWQCQGQTETHPPHVNTELYTWKAVIPFEEGMRLHEGLVNFQALKAGEELGRSGVHPLKAPADGWLLFPKYPRDPMAAPPKELYRILKRIKPDELGQAGVIGR
jgi:succinylglutamate desuccinylase